MFCPRCGANQGESRKFCTSCGTNLQMVAQALTGQLPLANYVPPPPVPVQHERHDEMSKGITMTVVGAAFLIFQLVNFIFTVHLTGARSPFNFWSFVALMVLAIGISKVISSNLLKTKQHPPAPELRSPQGSLPPNAQAELPQPVFSSVTAIEPSAPRTSELEPVRQPAPSVIEEETRTLPRRTSPQEMSR